MLTTLLVGSVGLLLIAGITLRLAAERRRPPLASYADEQIDPRLVDAALGKRSNSHLGDR